jgi:hypothetical protein
MEEVVWSIRQPAKNTSEWRNLHFHAGIKLRWGHSQTSFCSVRERKVKTLLLLQMKWVTVPKICTQYIFPLHLCHVFGTFALVACLIS